MKFPAPASWLNDVSLFKRGPRAADASGLDARITKAVAVRPVALAPSKQVETRHTARFAPHERETFLTDRSGNQVMARIINLSPSSVAIEADFSSIDGDEVVKVGTRRVKAGRKMLAGRVFLFDRPLSQSACRPDIIL